MKGVNMSATRFGLALAAFTAVTQLGCGSATLPQARVVETQAEIKAAETVGANEHPKAALHLKLAKEGLAAADELAHDGDEEEANLALQRAKVDAQLAVALAQEQEATQKARTAQQRIVELQTKK
jgi:hypothetical protein